MCFIFDCIRLFIWLYAFTKNLGRISFRYFGWFYFAWIVWCNSAVFFFNFLSFILLVYFESYVLLHYFLIFILWLHAICFPLIFLFVIVVSLLVLQAFFSHPVTASVFGFCWWTRILSLAVKWYWYNLFFCRIFFDFILFCQYWVSEIKVRFFFVNEFLKIKSTFFRSFDANIDTVQLGLIRFYLFYTVLHVFSVGLLNPNYLSIYSHYSKIWKAPFL